MNTWDDGEKQNATSQVEDSLPSLHARSRSAARCRLFDARIAPHHDDRVFLLQLFQFVLLALLALLVIGRRIAPALESKEANLLAMVVHELAILALRLKLDQFVSDGHVSFHLEAVGDDILQRYVIWK